MAQVVKSIPTDSRDLPILHSQYYGNWCPGHARGHCIGSHGIHLVYICEVSPILSTEKHGAWSSDYESYRFDAVSPQLPNPWHHALELYMLLFDPQFMASSH